MIKNFALMLIFGKPVIMYGGIITFIFLIFTAMVGGLNLRGINIVPFKWHPRLAVATIIIALMHAVFGLSIFYSF